MLYSSSDYFTNYSNLSAESAWQKRERLDYCEHPIVMHRGRIHSVISTWFAQVLTRRSLPIRQS